MIISSDAKFKVSIDFGKALEDLKQLDTEGKKRDEILRREAEGRVREAVADTQKEKEQGEAERGKFKISPFNPLETMLSAIGAIPGVGPSVENGIRTGINVSEGAVPFARGLVKGMSRELLKDMPDGMTKDLVEKSLSASLDAVGETSQVLADLKAANDAILPTAEKMKELAKLDLVTGGKAPPKEMANMAAAMYKVMWAQLELQRSVGRRAQRAVGEGLGEALGDAMTR